MTNWASLASVRAVMRAATFAAVLAALTASAAKMMLWRESVLCWVGRACAIYMEIAARLLLLEMAAMAMIEVGGWSWACKNMACKNRARSIKRLYRR